MLSDGEDASWAEHIQCEIVLSVLFCSQHCILRHLNTAHHKWCLVDGSTLIFAYIMRWPQVCAHPLLASEHLQMPVARDSDSLKGTFYAIE